MNELVTQALSVVGAVVILAAFGAQAMKWLPAGGRTYLALNFVGGVLLFITAVAVNQVGFILLEGAWALISLIGLLRIRTTPPANHVERAG